MCLGKFNRWCVSNLKVALVDSDFQLERENFKKMKMYWKNKIPLEGAADDG